MEYELNFENVPKWYVLCFNRDCPMRQECLRYLAGSKVPESLETAATVLPHAATNGSCLWFDKITVIEMATGFSHLYDHVLKKDFTGIRKRVTSLLHGAKFYYQCMRGERAITPMQQYGIQAIMNDFGYTDTVVFDRYYKSYVFDHQPTT